VPIFVPTRGTPPEPQSGWVHYVPDAATAMREAKASAGEQDVMVHGTGLAQSLLREGPLDELEIHLIPVVLGDERRLFGADRIELELTRVLDAPGSTQADPADVGLDGRLRGPPRRDDRLAGPSAGR
jgi:dihydrofolate reductase